MRQDIQKFEDGIADSPQNGFTNFQGCDVWSSPGYVKQYPAIFNQIDSGSSSMTAPKYMAYDPISNIYFTQDDTGHIWAKQNAGAWTLITGNTLTGALGQGIQVWQGYLFVFRSNAIDILLISSTFGSPTWTIGFGTNINITYNGSSQPTSGLVDTPSFVSNFNGNKIVFGVYVPNFTRAFIVSISTVFGKQFNPGDATTYQFLKDASDPNVGQPIVIPVTGIQITCIEQLGAALYFGTSANLVFPWDEVSIFVDTPLVSPEIYVYSMKRINNILYLAIGQRANTYYSNGTTIELFLRFPIYLYQNAANGSTAHGNGYVQVPKIEGMKGRLIMCVRGFSGNSINGLYILNIETKKIVLYNTAPSRPNAQVRTVMPDQSDNDRYYLGYTDNTFSAIASQNDQFNYSTDFSSFFVTALYNLGKKLSPETVARLDLMLTTILRTGQQIRVSSRTELSSGFTVIRTLVSTDEPTPNGFDFPTGIEKAINVELKFELAADVQSGAANHSVEFQNAVFYNNQ